MNLRLEPTTRTVMRTARRFPWKLFLVLVIVAIFGSAGAVFGVVQWIGRDLPTPDQLTQIRPAVKTTVFDAQGRAFHEFFKENRSPVPLKNIPRQLVNATISTEDRSFYHHWGVDIWGIGRAAMNNVLRRRTAEGGSTITQQLARNLFLTHERTVSRKLKEVALAVQIERNYSKNQILEMYFNQIYFGEGAYGVEAASKTFFGKSVRDLKLPESALLAGLPANPTRYSPRNHPEAAKARRGKVLRNMLATGAITRVEFDHAMGAPLGVTPQRYSNERAPYFTEMVRLHLDERYGPQAVYEGGLKVYTTLDMDLQQTAERALEKQLASLEAEIKPRATRAGYTVPANATASTTPYLQGAFAAIDPRNGYVRALVGGRDWNHSNFNRATQALRQPGSAFKPFVYTAAIDNGFRPTDIIEDAPVSFPGGDGKLYQPMNYDKKFRGPITLRYALQQSVNIPAIKLLRKVGTSLVASYARRMGIRSSLGQNLSLALGSSEVNLLELTSAYGVLANRGIRTDPLFILRVEDANGNVLEKNTPHSTEVLTEETAGVMTSMLQSVMDHGTGASARARGFTLPAAGKTGTMDEYMDAWFVGYIPSLVAGVWVGYDVKKSMGSGGTGSHAALPAWTEFMLAATRGRPVEDFPVPAGTVTRPVCAESGMLATEACATVTTETFNEGAEPTEYCTTHPGLPLAPSAPPTDPEQVEETVVAPPAAGTEAPRDLRELDRKQRARGDGDRSRSREPI